MDYLKLLIFVLLGLKRKNQPENCLDAKTAALWRHCGVGVHILPCECICSICDASKGGFWFVVWFCCLVLGCLFFGGLFVCFLNFYFKVI